MAHRRMTSDIPDFLRDSPFLPDMTPEINRATAIPTTRPFILNPLQLLRVAFRWRTLIGAFILLYTVYSVDWQTRRHGPSCLSYPPTNPVELEHEDVHWKRYAYVQYVTSPEQLCSSMIFFESLHRLGSKAERVIMYPKPYRAVNESREAMMLLSAEETWGVVTIPVDIQHTSGLYHQWVDNLNRLLVFNQRHWQRILLVDSDTTLLKPMDELFFLPSQPAIMPVAHWHKSLKLSTHIMLIEPSREQHVRVKQAIAEADYGITDADIMNDLYGRRKDCVVLPNRKYALLSSEFRKKNHDAYLGKGTKWDAQKVFEEAKVVSFSDNKLGRPWEAQWEDVKDYMPDCGGRQDCAERNIWTMLYSNYWKKAKDICWVQYGGLPTQF